MGAIVTTIEYPGFVDTVRNGYLYKKTTCLADSVIHLLKKGKSDYRKAMDYFESNFSYEAVISKWEQLLETGHLPEDSILHNKHYRLKWLKEFKRRLQKKLPFVYRLPTVERILLFAERMVHGRTTYIDS